MLWRNDMMIMLMSVNTTIHDMSLKCFDDDYVIVHLLYSFWQNKITWKIIWKVSYRCKFPALGPQRTAKFIIRKHMFQNSLHVYVHSVQIAVAHWTTRNSREWHHPVSWERTPSTVKCLGKSMNFNHGWVFFSGICQQQQQKLKQQHKI